MIIIELKITTSLQIVVIFIQNNIDFYNLKKYLL